MRKAGFIELILMGLLFTVLTLILYEVIPFEYSQWAPIIIIGVSTISGSMLVLMGFDYYRIKYSFSLTFIVLLVFLYELIIILTNAPYLLIAIGAFLAPYLGVYIHGSLRDIHTQRKAFTTATKHRVSFIRKLKSTIYQLDSTLWFFLIFGFSFLVLFMLTPIFMVLVNSFIPPAGGDWWVNYYNVLRTRSYVNYNPILSEPIQVNRLPDGTCIVDVRGSNYGPVLNSLIVASIVTIVATILGVIVAYVLARYTFPGRTVLRIMSLIPLFNTPFINSFVVQQLWSEAGPISHIYKFITGCYLRLSSLAGVAVAQIFAFFPIVYLNAYTAFLNVDPSTEEQAENLGAKGFRLFRSVTFPLALPGIVAGSILVFVFSLEDLGAPIVFNVKELMSYKIFESIITTSGMISPEVAALGVVLLVIALTSFLAIRNYVSMRSYAMISRGGRWKSRVQKPGVLGKLAIYLGVFPLVLFAMLPQIGVVLISIGVIQPYKQGYSLVFFIPDNPLFYFEKVLTEDLDVVNYIKNTIVYAGVSIIIAVFLAVAVGYSVSRLKVRYIPSILDSLATAPLAIPGLVMALGYYFLFITMSSLLPQGIGDVLSPVNPGFAAWLVFIIAFSVRRLPYVVRSVYAGFQQVHEALEESAMNLGASRYRVVFGVMMPLIIGYVLSGALIGFIYMATEVSTSVTFGSIRRDQAPLTFYMQSTLYGGGGLGVFKVAVMGTLLILIQLIIVIVVVFVFKQRYAFIGV